MSNQPHTAAVIQSLSLRREQRPIALIDIDGIVQNVNHRLHHIVHDVDGVSKYKNPPDWKSFVEQAHLDVPGAFVEVVRALSQTYDIIYLTARVSNDAKMYWDLYDRLETVVGAGHLLITRHKNDEQADGKYMPAAQFKSHIVDRIKLAGFTPSLAIDDSHENCKAFVEAGIPTLRGYNHISASQYNY